MGIGNKLEALMNCGCCGRVTCEYCNNRQFPTYNGVGDVTTYPGGLPATFYLNITLTCSHDGFVTFAYTFNNVAMTMVGDRQWSTEDAGGLTNPDMCDEPLQIGLICVDDRWYVTGIQNTTATEGCLDFTVDVTNQISCSPFSLSLSECSETDASGNQLNPAFSCCGAGQYVCCCDDASPDGGPWSRSDAGEQAVCDEGGEPRIEADNCDPCENNAPPVGGGNCAGCCDICVDLTITEDTV